LVNAALEVDRAKKAEKRRKIAEMRRQLEAKKMALYSRED